MDRLGRVCNVNLASTGFYDVLPNINYLKLSASESQFVKVKDISRKTIVLLTRGKNGCTIIQNGKEFEITTRSVPEKDPTGAGDFFLAGFACGVLRKYSLEKCAQIASYCGGLAVGEVGIPTKIEINESLI